MLIQASQQGIDGEIFDGKQITFAVSHAQEFTTYEIFLKQDNKCIISTHVVGNL